MDSLVGYGSSDSDGDGEPEDGNSRSAEEVGDETSPVKRTRNFLLEADSASSDSDPEEDDPGPSSSSPPPPHPRTPTSSATRQPGLPAPPLASLNPNKLPPPSLTACSDSSVFANPFKAQADQKLSALQKHVPLTMQAKPSQIGGKRMCVSYRKDGRCRFGIKCKFAHDSDLQTPAAPSDAAPPASEEASDDPAESQAGGSAGGEAKEEEPGGTKKRRVGLSNTLIPPKRAMKQYAMQRDRERINMS